MTFGIPIETLPGAIGGDRLPRMPPTTASSNAAKTTTDNRARLPVPDLGTPPPIAARAPTGLYALPGKTVWSPHKRLRSLLTVRCKPLKLP